MATPLRQVAFRLSRLDWTGPSTTEQIIHDREQIDETAADAAHRLVKVYRRPRRRIGRSGSASVRRASTRYARAAGRMLQGEEGTFIINVT